MAKVTPVSLNDPQNPIRCEFSLIDPETPGKWHILVARFVGTYRIGCKGNPDAMFIASMARAAVFNWGPSGVILDLSQLDYKWGDNMEEVLNVPQWAGFDIPFAVLVGAESREAIASLKFGVETKKQATEVEGYFDTLAAAIEYLLPRSGPWPVTTPEFVKQLFGNCLLDRP